VKPFTLAAPCGLLLFLTTASLPGADENDDGLPDIWQENFRATNLSPDEDSDGDGYSNAREALAGTDPFSTSHHPALGPFLIAPGGDPMALTFPTEVAKSYQLAASPNVAAFTAFGPAIDGTGHEHSLTLSHRTASMQSGCVHHSLWADVAVNEMSALADLPNFPDNPVGETFLPTLEAPRTMATGYAGRMMTAVTPPEDGNFTFALSTGSPAVLIFHNADNPEEPTTLAETFPGQEGIAPGSFDQFPTQRSAPIALSREKSYLLEVRYLALTPKNHCQVGWSGPGLVETELITGEALAPVEFIPAPNDAITLLNRDYEARGPDGLPLWPENTRIVAAPEGMTANAEEIFGDPGNRDAETILFPESATSSFYATWQFQLRPGHEELNFFFTGPTDKEEGPRVLLQTEDKEGVTRVLVRAGDSWARRYFDIAHNTTYRIEIVASLDGPFRYRTGAIPREVAEDTFDLYLTEATGNLVASRTGMVFRDKEPDAVKGIDRMRAVWLSNPDCVVDSWEITSGLISGQGYLTRNIHDLPEFGDAQFFQLQISDSDQDNDGLTDWEEQLIAPYQPFLFFDAESSPAGADLEAFATLHAENTGPATVSLAAADTAAYESNSPNPIPDNGAILLTRTGSMAPLTVKLCVAPIENTGNTATVCDGRCCSLVGSAGDEQADLDDHRLVDDSGATILDTVTFAYGEMSKTLTVIATPDLLNEYPETLNLALADPTDESYEISSSLNGASIQLFDLPENPANNAIFTGTFSPDGNAVTGTQGSGFTSAILNGPRTKVYLSNEFSNLTSDQQDSHVHKSNPGPSPGSIIYAITNEPGGESQPPPASDPLIGPIDNYEWDLTESSGAVPTSGGAASKQTIIDSLFGQNGETPLYLNIHTADNPAGEIWAFLNLSGGSISDPGAPPAPAEPGSEEYPQLAGAELASEARRFLNQATFGATTEAVASLVEKIETARESDPDYHRDSAYRDWIDVQIALPQSYQLDYHLANDFQYLTLRGMFDSEQNPPQQEWTTPDLPNTWPIVNRSAGDPDHWHLDAPYPVVRDDYRLANANDLYAEPRNRERRHAQWQMMLNARDQMRHKMGFALQQIVVVSAAASTISGSPYAASNYQDQLNTRAFSHYRDVLGFVNWNPLMGKWLSSLQNQKGLDLDGDGVDDISPDENLARENMQLFSIGLFDLWPDGSLRLGPDGAPNNTYTNADIREFAKVLTGQSFRFDIPYNGDAWGGVPYVDMVENDRFDLNQGSDDTLDIKYAYPMKMFGEYHDRSVKTFAGTTIDNTHLADATAQGIADIEEAMDWLAGKPDDGQPDYDYSNSHGSTPPFISLRLIQRFTTSNPSQDYLHRVATAFKDSEGNLATTLRAILLDPEARVPDPWDPTFGVKASPLESFAQVLRSLPAHTYIPLEDPGNSYPFNTVPGDFSAPELHLANFGYPAAQLAGQERNVRFLMNYTITSGTTGLQMVPFRQETVFNWYLPDYAPSGPIAEAGLVAPELQLANEPDVIRNINYLHALTRWGRGIYIDTLVGSRDVQAQIFGEAGDSEARYYNNVRIDDLHLVNQFYPATPPTDLPDGRSAESVADEMLLNALDERLTLGYLKKKHPYDASDDDDPAVAGEDDLLKNPRELIIDSLNIYWRDPFDGNNDEDERTDKLRTALYLLSVSPEFQIRK
jgi:uncharacterized protein (DUF1800 family)